MDKRKRIGAFLRKKGFGKLRVVFTRSRQHLYAQLIDDQKHATIVFVSTNSQRFKKSNSDLKSWSNLRCAEILAQEMLQKIQAPEVQEVIGVRSVYFDRAGRLYTGVVKKFADTLRSHGLHF